MLFGQQSRGWLGEGDPGGRETSAAGSFRDTKSEEGLSTKHCEWSGKGRLAGHEDQHVL